MRNDQRAGLRVLALGAVVLVSGCAATSQESAWKVVQQQQEAQMAMRQQEADEARRQAPTQPQLLMSLVREAQSQGRYFASLAYIDAYVQAAGSNPEIEALRAEALRLTGQPTQSEAAYRALLGTPQAARAWHGLGLLAGARGDLDRAAADLGRAAALAPTDAQVLNDLGYAHLLAGRPGEARLPLGKAAELAPGNAKVLSNLALLLLVQGDEGGAVRVMNDAGLPDPVRDEVRRLAAELRPLASKVPEPSYSAAHIARDDPAAMDARPIVRDVSGAPASAPVPSAPVQRESTAALRASAAQPYDHRPVVRQ